MRVNEIDTETFLARLPLFRELEADERARLGARTRRVELRRGQILFNAGDEPQGLFALIFGQIKLSFSSARGDEKIVEIVGPGQSFGEAVMFLSRPYPVGAQALSDSLVLCVDKEAVFEELQRDPRFAAHMIAGLSRRLHGLMADIEANSMYSGTQRLIGFLLRDCDTAGPEQQLDIELETTKGVLASRLSITQEHLSRILHDLSHQGLIRVEGRRIHVLDAAKLLHYRP